ncbi:hypothetical protein [Mycobacterium sp. 1274761.0]|uniref:hypothetical protein n=1 Tax=Mycobacterium sp. 1274761.0 TaxID=1834077 RepID=UPI0007FF011D|nr:hypothetical protein [Mycobacterium sp. 1274761.0]OBK70807.1 hypothetical protein A5651_21510 [Mycobacterium sp. 1274761.0]
MSAPSPRPRTVNAAFWCWAAASLLLIVGGLITASIGLPALFRGAGVLTALAGAGIAFLAGRSRVGDPRFRRAALALSMAIIVLVALLSVLGVIHILTLIAVLPLIAAIALITRPSAADFYQELP